LKIGDGIMVEDKKKPCCAASVLREAKYISIGGPQVGISQLDSILKDARDVESHGELAIRKELLRLVKIYNYVPSSVETAYENALYVEYLKRRGTPDDK
jgi:hypothetical protein